MEQQERKLPVGIQNFEQIITENYLLVDKTEYIYNLVHSGMPYFLSRPRGFGKSLLLSTMKAYWEGKKELFSGLKIEKLEEDNPDAWQPHPVFYFDFNATACQNELSLEAKLNSQLTAWEESYKVKAEGSIEYRFKRLLENAYKKTGKRCVVLVDEYDRQLPETIGDEELSEHNNKVFKNFFSILKSEDASIQFVFITGVTKFTRMSIFGDLNHLRDISMSPDYAEICGITEQEVLNSFMPEVEKLADEQALTLVECLIKLKQQYGGYHFHQNGGGVINPYSLLNALAERKFDAYWFKTGTPTSFVKRLKETRFDPRKFMNRTLYATRQMLKDYRDDNPDLIPLLYQSGYLTLIDYKAEDRAYTLGFPNAEVKYGFFGSLLPEYMGDTGVGSDKVILSLKTYLQDGDLEQIGNTFIALFAGIPYPTNDVSFEHDFQSVIYITMTLLGRYFHCNKYMSKRIINCTVETSDYVYVFGFKCDSRADAILKQIDGMYYEDIYAEDTRKLYKIGMNFDSETRQLSEWKVEEMLKPETAWPL